MTLIRAPGPRATSTPTSLEKGLRSERALKVALAEMYVQGVSTRKVAAITEEMCGFAVSSARSARQRPRWMRRWKRGGSDRWERIVTSISMPATNMSATAARCVDAAVLVAAGVREADGKREILGVSVALVGAGSALAHFLQEPRRRGLHGVQLIS